MKGVILAGGLGTRLHPLTKATNKHLLPVGAEPMIYHAIRQLRAARLEEILVVTSTSHMGDIVRCLGSGAEFGCSLTYRVQETAGGIAHALALAESFAGGQDVCVILGDNIFEYSIEPYVDQFRGQGGGASVVLKKVNDPEQFGVAALDERQIIDIQEKPAKPASQYAVVGLYCYDPGVFDVIRTIAPSPRGELEITAVNRHYIAQKALTHSVCHGRWTDAGTLESWAEATSLLLETGNRILPHPAR